jgi:hypothetical protein
VPRSSHSEAATFKIKGNIQMNVLSQAPGAAPLILPGIASAAPQTAFFAVQNATSVVPGFPTLTQECVVFSPGSNRVNGLPFIVRAAGYITIPAGTNTTAATPLQIQMFGSAVITTAFVNSNHCFCSLTAVAIYTYAAGIASYIPFCIAAQFVGSNNSTLAAFNMGGQTADPNGVNLVTVPAATTVGIAFNSQNDPSAKFTVGIATATGGVPGNGSNVFSTANLTSLVLEV